MFFSPWRFHPKFEDNDRHQYLRAVKTLQKIFFPFYGLAVKTGSIALQKVYLFVCFFLLFLSLAEKV